MAKKRKASPRPKVRRLVSGGTCELFSTHAMVCPLCRTLVPAKTAHKCEVLKDA